MNVLYVLQKLTGGTRTFVWFGGSLRLEENLHLLGVLGRSGLSVVGGHLDGSSEVCLHRVRFYAGQCSTSGRVPKRGDQEMGSSVK